MLHGFIESVCDNAMLLVYLGLKVVALAETNREEY